MAGSMRRSQSDPSIHAITSTYLEKRGIYDGGGIRPTLKKPASEFNPELVVALNSRYTRPRSSLTMDRNWFSERLTDFKDLVTMIPVKIDSEKVQKEMSDILSKACTVKFDCKINGVALSAGWEVVQDDEFRDQFGFSFDQLIVPADFMLTKLPFTKPLRFCKYNKRHYPDNDPSPFIKPRVAACKDPKNEQWKRCEHEFLEETKGKKLEQKPREFAKIKRIWERAGYKAPQMIFFLRALSRHMKDRIEQRSGIRKELLFAKPENATLETSLYLTDSLRSTQSKKDLAQSVFNFTKRDFHEVLLRAGIVSLTRHQMNILFNCFDSNSNGEISMEEFYYATEHLVQAFEHELEDRVRHDKKLYEEIPRLGSYCIATPRLEERPRTRVEISRTQQLERFSHKIEEEASEEVASKLADETTLRPEQLAGAQ